VILRSKEHPYWHVAALVAANAKSVESIEVSFYYYLPQSLTDLYGEAHRKLPNRCGGSDSFQSENAELRGQTYSNDRSFNGGSGSPLQTKAFS
jgi:hypothetical protein